MSHAATIPFVNLSAIGVDKILMGVNIMSQSAPSSAEEKMLRDAFLPEERDGAPYYVYYNDEKYYLILSLCEKYQIKYRTKANCIMIAMQDFNRLTPSVADEPQELAFETADDAVFAQTEANIDDSADDIASEAEQYLSETSIEYPESRIAAAAGAEPKAPAAFIPAAPQPIAGRAAPSILKSPAAAPAKPSFFDNDTPVTVTQQPVVRRSVTAEQTAESRSRSLEIREQALLARENAVVDREKSISAREDALQSRKSSIIGRKAALERHEKNLIQLQSALESRHAVIENQQSKIGELKTELVAFAESGFNG